jgi:hypothetical protein
MIDDSVGILDYNLQTIVDNTYLMEIYTADGMETVSLDCLDYVEGANIPEGCHILWDSSSASLFALDNATIENDAIIYSANKAIIPFDTDIYKIIIHDILDGETYERTVINKLDKKYLPKAD